MAKFNGKKAGAPRSQSYEGGMNYVKNPVEDWLNFLFSSYIEDRFYEDADEQLTRYDKLTYDVAEKYGWEFVAKAAMFARQDLGMRSIAEYTAAMLNDHQFDAKRAFFRNFPHRPDDVAEIFSVIDKFNGKRSHALIRGCGDYISGLRAKNIMKYQMKGKDYNMFDLINLTHAHSKTIDQYKAGQLQPADTWEVKISGAANEKEKNREWMRLVEEHKLNYLALLRNLRNIIEAVYGTGVGSHSDLADKWVIDNLLPQIESEKDILASKVFPYQIYSAAKNLGFSHYGVLNALNYAFRISCKNMPRFDNAVVVLDVSGSMDSPISRNSNITIKEASAVYATALYLGNDADFIKFGNHAKMKKFNKANNAFDIIAEMVKNEDCGYGTDVSSAFQMMRKHYDHIFLVSDMQTMSPASRGWWGNRSGIEDYNDYCNHYGVAKLYSFDLGNYKDQVANPNNPNVFLLTSLSEKVFQMLSYISNGDSLVDYINTYNYK